jgi:hypothetical protein
MDESDGVGGLDILDVSNASRDDVDYMPNALVILDNEDILLDIDIESEDELQLWFPKDRSSKNIIAGGPQKSDVPMPLNPKPRYCLTIMPRRGRLTPTSNK